MERVGIISYLNKKTFPFSGKIKKRYTDFLVREIDLDGTIQTLCSIQKEEVFVEKLKDLIDEKTFSKINNLFNEGKGTVLTETIESKKQRTEIHEAIRREFTTLGTKTKNDNKIEISFSNKREKKQLLSFIMYKENITTQEAIEKIAKATRIPSKNFSVAGTKDKRAITVQRVTVRTSIDVLKRCKLPTTIKVSGVEPIKNSLRLGSLSGNHFDIFIREIKVSGYEEEKLIELIKGNIESIKKNGFINYFGLQRFGSYEQNKTHLVGLMLLKKEWKKACETLLLSPKKTFIEFKIETHLKKHNADYEGAIKNLPWNTRLLYLHALQSYIWNKSVSRAFLKEEYDPIDLPGCSIDLEKCNEEIKELGMSIEEFKELCKEASLHGSERSLIVFPKNLNYSFIKYKDEISFCLQKEMNSLMGIDLEERTKDLVEKTQCLFLGLKLSFSLPPSSYATMFLRELMRADQ